MWRILSFAILAVLTACSPAQTPQERTNAETSVSVPASRTAAPSSAASEWAVSPAGLGPIRIGMRVSEVEAALGGDIVIDTVATEDAEECAEAFPKDARFQGISFLFQQGRLSYVQLNVPERGVAPSYRTSAGIGLGSSDAALRAAYPNVEREVQPYSGGGAYDFYAWSSPDRGLRFQADPHGTIYAIYAGDRAIRSWEGCL